MVASAPPRCLKPCWVWKRSRVDYHRQQRAGLTGGLWELGVLGHADVRPHDQQRVPDRREPEQIDVVLWHVRSGLGQAVGHSERLGRDISLLQHRLWNQL